MNRQANTLFALLLLSISALPAVGPAHASNRGANVADTPHNLSAGGKGAPDKGHTPMYQSTKEERICIFCHAPHHANAEGPLWSRQLSTITAYIPYGSTTLKAKPGQPKGASRLCLSCHDGTVALGALTGTYNLDGGMPKMVTDTADTDPAKKTNLGWDLSDDHPISFPYAYEPGAELENPQLLAAKGIRLSDGLYLECTSCHDPHNNVNDNFTVINNIPRENSGTPLCIACHRKAGWDLPDSTHQTGGTRDAVNGANVSKSGCINCHFPHSAPGAVHLLKSAVPSENCFHRDGSGTCHNGSNSDGDILSLFKKPYTHSVPVAVGGGHVENEPLPAKVKHVECVDCHNPHQAGYQGVPLGSPNPALLPAATPPEINGALRGVRGVDESGKTEVTPATAEYQVCFKCHAYTNAIFKKFIDRPVRQTDELDESLRFAAGNMSYHPVIGSRQGAGRSLLLQYRTTMTRIYCCNCHSPMGADEPHMLTGKNSETYPSSDKTYPLCFSCHDQDYLLNPMRPPNAPSVALHKAHVLDHPGKEAPCSACHDPHGVATNPHLINFDTRYAGAAAVYSAGSCSVSCHATNPRSY